MVPASAGARVSYPPPMPVDLLTTDEQWLARLHALVALMKGVGVFGLVFWSWGWAALLAGAYLLDFILWVEKADMEKQKALEAFMRAPPTSEIEGGRFSVKPGELPDPGAVVYKKRGKC